METVCSQVFCTFKLVKLLFFFAYQTNKAIVNVVFATKKKCLQKCFKVILIIVEKQKNEEVIANSNINK
jgi:hypothetical protein